MRFSAASVLLFGAMLAAAPASAAEIARQKIAQWGDPLTPPHTRTSCISYASGNWPWGGGWKTCNGWKTDVQTMQVEAFLVTSGPDDLKQEVMKSVTRCAMIAGVAGAGAGYASGGTAAVTAAKVAFSACLSREGVGMADKYNISVETKSHWSDWS